MLVNNIDFITIIHQMTSTNTAFLRPNRANGSMIYRDHMQVFELPIQDTSTIYRQTFCLSGLACGHSLKGAPHQHTKDMPMHELSRVSLWTQRESLCLRGSVSQLRRLMEFTLMLSINLPQVCLLKFLRRKRIDTNETIVDIQ